MEMGQGLQFGTRGLLKICTLELCWEGHLNYYSVPLECNLSQPLLHLLAAQWSHLPERETNQRWRGGSEYSRGDSTAVGQRKLPIGRWQGSIQPVDSRFIGRSLLVLDRIS